ncbi:lantibiotic dehydratase [Auritidibacter ignavus]|uniref:lantibiotic dehydratase n=1 Tax=Auritidibacter ignavus TaxID=678932 RepID=UPI00244D271B|nr:lantibiotic dehydratase [Auritidibacter ignavus]WGH91963.1 lantibiotic dehydratase [Auritidibacter ignavus]
MPLWHQHKFSEFNTYNSLLEGLATLLCDSHFKLTLQTSSPSLLKQLQRLLDRPTDLNNPRTRKALRTLRKYLIRMSRRSTPFGLISGVAIGQFANTSTLKPANNPAGTIEVFPDYEWLMNVAVDITKLDTDGCLPITLNPYIHQLGERLDVAHANAFGLKQSVHIDFRATSATDAVIELATTGASRSEIIVELLTRHTDVDRETVGAFVDDLVWNGVITEKLQPGLESGQELSSIVTTLSKSSSLGEYARTLAKLDLLCRSICTLEDLRSHWDSIQRTQNSISGNTEDGGRLSINSSLRLQEVTLHENVARRVEQVANLLVGTDFYPHRPQHLVNYEHHFLERYGVEGEVPILELLSASRGLEAPDTYRVPPRTYTLPSFPSAPIEQRTTALIGAYSDALRSDSPLELTDELLSAHATSDYRPPNPTLEFFVRVLSSSRESIEQDDFDLFVIPDGLAQGGRSIGRFVRLLGEEAHGLADRLFKQEVAQSAEDTLLVQLRYMPDKARMANVARTTDLGLKILSLGTAEESTLTLNDVLVGNDGSRFYLRDASSGHHLRIVENHMVSTLNAPNVVRLMLDLSNDWYRSFNMFDWGALRDATFLPRVTRGRIILSPAKWNVKTGIMNKLIADVNSCPASHIQASLGLPNHVVVVQGDNRLPLDLRTEIDRDILDDEISKAHKSGIYLTLEERVTNLGPGSSRGVFTEVPEPGEVSWLADNDGRSYDHELVVPVIWTGPQAGTSRPKCTTSQRKRATAVSSYEWDTRWVCLDVYGGLQNLDSVVGLHLLDLRGSMRSSAPMWFFIRYSTPAHRLRIRLRAASVTDISSVRSALLEWAQRLLERSLIYDYSLVSFTPEINRFGGNAAYGEVLSVFATSSDLACFVSQLRVEGKLREIPDEILGVYMLASCRRSIDLSPGELSPSPSKEKEFREYYRLHRQELISILAGGHLQNLDDVTQSRMQELCSNMATEMARYSTLLSAQHLSATRNRAAFGSVIHMTFNRTFPIGNAVEQRALDLWALASDAYDRRKRALTENKDYIPREAIETSD